MSIFVHVIPMHWKSKHHFHTEWMSMEIMSFVNKGRGGMISFCGWVICRLWWGIIWSRSCIISSKMEDFFKSTSIFRWRIAL